MIGPEARNCAWDEALAKYDARAMRWGTKGELGSFLKIRCYNVFAVSVLQFLCQFYAPSDAVVAAQKSRVTSMFSGPHQWCSMEHLLHLKDWFHFTNQPADIENVAIAAKGRVYLNERWFVENPEPLKALKNVDSMNILSKRFTTWAWGGIFGDIQAALAIIRDISNLPERPKDKKETGKVQKKIMKILQDEKKLNLTTVCAKMRRWRLGVPDHILDQGW